MNGDYNDFFFPLVGLNENPETKRYDIKEIYGTAFYISNGFYLSAGHSIKNAIQCEKYGIAHKALDGKYKISFGIDNEVFDNKDIGIIKTEHEFPSTKVLKWDFDFPDKLSDVIAIGYPYGLNPIQNMIKCRGFKGYITSVCKFWRFPDAPAVFELSFQCPRGLSGSPLLLRNSNKIIGVVIGNEQTEMEIYREKETIIEKIEQTYIRTEYFTYGIAISAKEIGEIRSTMLNSLISEYLHTIEIE